ncbi:MAG: nucleotidyltransferase family protein [Sphingomonadaceae bacterium]
MGSATAPSTDRPIEELRALLASRPAEERLLAAAARIHLDGAARERVELLLAEPLDWERLVSRAEGHRVAPLVYRTLSLPPFAPQVPAGALSRLHAAYLLNGISTLLWQRELRRVVDGLATEGIAAVLLKGAALLHTVYPDPALRQLRDLDLLVQREDRAAAERVLLSLGYLPAEEEWPAGKWPPEWYEKKYRLRDGGGRAAVVEIHWGLARKRAPFHVDVAEMLQHSEAIPVDGVEGRVLSPIHQVIHLCTHMAYNDGFGVGLSRLSDLHELVERHRDRLDWEALAREAGRLRAALCLRYSLAVAAALFGTELPPDLIESPGGKPLRPALAAAALERVLANDEDPAPLPSTLAKLVSTDRTSLGSLLQLLMPRPRHLRHSYRLLEPVRLIRALRYVRSIR